MFRRGFLFTVAAFVIASGASLAGPPVAPKVGKSATHANLTVFFLHGPDAAPSKTVITLKEAMEKKIVIVHETSTVNCLSVENTSPDVEVFIMAGDVVKGGKQDRAIALDILLPRKSGAVPAPAFCVERGRWSQRGAEGVAKFECSETQVCNRALKVAVNEARQQGEVWKEVDVAQKKLADNLGKEVRNAASPTSLQLALEDKDLKSKLAEYEAAISKACDGGDIVGIAVAINGQLVGADVFASNDLFMKLWPKLLKSAATEAISEVKDAAKFTECDKARVEAFFEEASAPPEKEVKIEAPTRQAGQMRQSSNRAVPEQQTRASGQELRTEVTGPSNTGENKPASAAANPPKYRARILQRSGSKTLLIESQDRDQPGVVWHRSYVAKP